MLPAGLPYREHGIFIVPILYLTSLLRFIVGPSSTLYAVESIMKAYRYQRKDKMKQFRESDASGSDFFPFQFYSRSFAEASAPLPLPPAGVSGLWLFTIASET